jgi:hypothetical protein
MDVAALITAITQLGMAAAAWRLANALKGRVDDHETRIGKLETA